MKKSEKEKKPLWKRILKVCGIVLAVLLALVVLLFGFLTITEYRPAATEEMEITGEASAKLSKGESVTIMTWNTGYGALGDNADFFMDGGTGVKTADKARVLSNVSGMMDTVQAIDPDIVFLQETDVDSTRSEHVAETSMWREAFPEEMTSFANNFKVAFVPYPIPPIGKVDSGILTLTKYQLTDAERVALPCPFSWPVRTANLKRCLLITRVSVEGTDAELVLINLHLEAYDSGEGKIAQTKQLREVLEKEVAAGNYVIAGGDFNQTFSTVDETLYPAQEGKWQAGAIDVTEFGEDFLFLMDESTPTCRSLDQPYIGADRETFQYYMIDGFIVSPNISVESLTTLDEAFEYTDHNPVVLTFSLD